MSRRLFRLATDRRGAAAVEFALLAPTFLAMFLGVLQFGLGLQAYNALRGASADTARNVTVQYQTDNRLSDSQISQIGMSIATTAPYLLSSDPTKLQVNVQTAATQYIPTAKELTLTFTYTVPTLLDFAGLSGPTLTFTRPIFVPLS